MRTANMYQLKVGMMILIIDMDMPENNCPELTEKTSNIIDDAGLRQLFISTQMNNLDLCVKSALQ